MNKDKRIGLLYLIGGLALFVIILFAIGQFLNGVGILDKTIETPATFITNGLIQSYPALSVNLTEQSSITNLIQNPVPLGAFEMYVIAYNAQILFLMFLLVTCMFIIFGFIYLIRFPSIFIDEGWRRFKGEKIKDKFGLEVI